jgi:hypothetical protein
MASADVGVLLQNPTRAVQSFGVSDAIRNGDAQGGGGKKLRTRPRNRPRISVGVMSPKANERRHMQPPRACRALGRAVALERRGPTLLRSRIVRRATSGACWFPASSQPHGSAIWAGAPLVSSQELIAPTYTRLLGTRRRTIAGCASRRTVTNDWASPGRRGTTRATDARGRRPLQRDATIKPR